MNVGPVRSGPVRSGPVRSGPVRSGPVRSVKLSCCYVPVGLTHMQILANSILFFVAAYDTTTTTLMFILYNLALNPDCQDRVAEEVDSVMGENVCFLFLLLFLIDSAHILN